MASFVDHRGKKAHGVGDVSSVRRVAQEDAGDRYYQQSSHRDTPRHLRGQGFKWSLHRSLSENR